MTGLGNTVINLMCIKYAMDKLQYEDYDCVVEGDDSLIGTNHELFDRLKPIYESLGFAVTVESQTEGLEGSVFCK